MLKNPYIYASFRSDRVYGQIIFLYFNELNMKFAMKGNYRFRSRQLYSLKVDLLFSYTKGQIDHGEDLKQAKFFKNELSKVFMNTAYVNNSFPSCFQL